MSSIQTNFLIDYHLDGQWLVVLAIAAFLLDIRTNPCIIEKTYTSNQIFGVLFLHHLLNTFANFGWLVNNVTLLKFYIVAPAITMIHWYTNNNQCAISQWANRLCKDPESAYFRDLFYMVGIKEWKHYDVAHYTYLIAGILVAIYKITLLS